MFSPSLPMDLFHDRTLCGRIVSYGYETPWASGRLEPVAHEHCRVLVEVCQLHEAIESWPEAASPEAEQARWDAELLRRGITEQDDEAWSAGAWVIRNHDGSEVELPSPPHFDAQGFVTWRW